MRQREFYVKSKFDRLQISVMEIIPDGRPRAVVYVAHGLCGCKERFLQLLEYLSYAGYVCIASDHRGHGGSVLREEDRGYMYGGGAHAIVVDMDSVVDYIEEHFGNLKLIIVGHSMGSLAARAYVKKHGERLDGLVLCGSPSPNVLTPLAHLLLRGLCGIGLGHWRVSYIQKLVSNGYNKRFRSEGPQAWTCSDPDVRRVFAEDPRCVFTISADCASALMDLFQETYSVYNWHPGNLKMPILFMSGEDDPCMISGERFARSVNCMRLIGYVDVRVHVYTGMRHEILNESNREVVWNDMLAYLSQIAPTAPADTDAPAAPTATPAAPATTQRIRWFFVVS